MSTIARGYRDLVLLVETSTEVDPVTRRPLEVDAFPAGTDTLAVRIVARADRSIVRDPLSPSRVLIDHDVLADPSLAEHLRIGVELRHVDGRRFVIAGGVSPLTRATGPAVYVRVPAVQRGPAAVLPDPDPTP